MLLNLSLFVFDLLSSDEAVVTYLHDLIQNNIAPLISFPFAFVKSSFLLSNSLKLSKGGKYNFGCLGIYLCIQI